MIHFILRFEGYYEIMVSVQDSRELRSIGTFVLNCVSNGTWLNHPPVVVGDYDHPQVCRVGEVILLSEPTIHVVDPDGDKIYYSCNIGSIGIDASGKAVWTFQPNFPGSYAIHITAMDIRGGFATFTLHIEVHPWWST